MNTAPRASHHWTERWARPSRIIFGVALVSLALLAAALVAGKTFDGAELLYDLAVGVGVATALSIVVSLYFWHLEARQEELRDQHQRALAEAERQREEEKQEISRREQERWAQIHRELDDLRVQSLDLDLQRGLGELTIELAAHAQVLHQLQDDVRRVLMRVDPTYRHPNADLVDRIMRRLDEAVVAHAADRPTAAGTGDGDPHSRLFAEVEQMIQQQSPRA